MVDMETGAKFVDFRQNDPCINRKEDNSEPTHGIWHE